MNTITRRSLKGALLIGGLCVLAPSVYGQGIGLKKLDEMLTPTENAMRRGRVVYERQCITCHGDQGRNDTEWARENGLTGSLTDDEFTYGGGLIQSYNLISKKQPGVNHPVYTTYIPYQDRWAVSHYVRGLSAVSPLDPPEVRAQAEREAIDGVCDEATKSSIGSRVEPQGEEQLAAGAEIYKAQCASCHGDEGLGDGPAAGALNPPPRNFVKEPREQWTNGTSPLAIFGTLARGIEGTSMASYASLPEEERWALTHYVRNWVPEAERGESSEAQILEVCRSLSTPAKPDAIPVELAMKFLIEDAPNKRALRRARRGPVYRYGDADAQRGGELFAQHCASCHGTRGDGTRPAGPYGAVPPYLYLTVAPLQNVDAAGSFDAFATRSSQGVHATLPDMMGAALMSEGQWKDVQAYVSLLDGDAEFVEASQARLTDAPTERVQIELDASGAPINRRDDGVVEATTFEALKADAERRLNEEQIRVEYYILASDDEQGEVAERAVEEARRSGLDVILDRELPSEVIADEPDEEAAPGEPERERPQGAEAPASAPPAAAPDAGAAPNTTGAASDTGAAPAEREANTGARPTAEPAQNSPQ